MRKPQGFAPEYENASDRERQGRALIAGHTTYMPNERCNRGHLSERFARTNVCVECTKVSRRKIQPSEDVIALAVQEDVDRVIEATRVVPENPQPKRGRTLREVARAFGCETFHPIARCPHGHDSPRNTEYGYCIQCHRERSKVR